MIQFTGDVAAEIAATIGTRKPETGGALFGPKNSNLISMIAFDEAVHTTSVSYTPSKELIASIPEIEADEGVEFKGIIQSHPRGVTQPSGPDLAAYARTLNKNTRLASLVTPIVIME